MAPTPLTPVTVLPLLLAQEKQQQFYNQMDVETPSKTNTNIITVTSYQSSYDCYDTLTPKTHQTSITLTLLMPNPNLLTYV